MVQTERMDNAPTVRKYTSFDEMKADETGTGKAGLRMSGWMPLTK